MKQRWIDGILWCSLFSLVGILFEDQMAVEFLKNFEIISKPFGFDLFKNLGEIFEEFLEQMA